MKCMWGRYLKENKFDTNATLPPVLILIILYLVHKLITTMIEIDAEETDTRIKHTVPMVTNIQKKTLIDTKMDARVSRVELHEIENDGGDWMSDLREWIPWLRKVAYGIDPHFADDLAQEGMIALWKAQRVHNPDRSPLNYWLKFKAYRRMTDVWKSHRVQVVRPDGSPQWVLKQDPREPIGEGADTLDSPVWMDLDKIQMAYHHGEIASALGALTPRQREYVYMRFWRQATGAELRAHFGYDPGGLWRSAVNGARGKLQEALAHLA